MNLVQAANQLLKNKSATEESLVAARNAIIVPATDQEQLNPIVSLALITLQCRIEKLDPTSLSVGAHAIVSQALKDAVDEVKPKIPEKATKTYDRWKPFVTNSDVLKIIKECQGKKLPEGATVEQGSEVRINTETYTMIIKRVIKVEPLLILLFAFELVCCLMLQVTTEQIDAALRAPIPPIDDLMNEELCNGYGKDPKNKSNNSKWTGVGILKVRDEILTQFFSAGGGWGPENWGKLSKSKVAVMPIQTLVKAHQMVAEEVSKVAIQLNARAEHL